MDGNYANMPLYYIYSYLFLNIISTNNNRIKKGFKKQSNITFYWQEQQTISPSKQAADSHSINLADVNGFSGFFILHATTQWNNKPDIARYHAQ